MINAPASKTGYWGFDSLPMHMEYITMTKQDEAGLIGDSVIKWFPEMSIFKGNYAQVYIDFNLHRDVFEVTMYYKDNCGKLDSYIDLEGRSGHNSREDWEILPDDLSHPWIWDERRTLENCSVQNYNDVGNCSIETMRRTRES